MNKAFVERLDALGYESPLTIADVVKDMSANKYVLPSIQREFVWSTSQIEKLFDSVMQVTVLETKVFPELQEKYLADSKSGPCLCFKGVIHFY